MSFQHSPEHFAVNTSPQPASPQQRECGGSSTGVETLPGRSVSADVMMVQTPNGAAMIVPVYRRPEQRPPAEARVHVFNRTADASLMTQGGVVTIALPAPSRALVAAAPIR